MRRKSPKICLACSAGGHLRELQLAIGSIPERYDCYWLTLSTTSTRAFMRGREHVFLVNFQPRRWWTLWVNAAQALFWVLAKRPDVIITTGAGVVVPTVFFAKKLLDTKVVFINSAADVVHASKTPLWIERYADLFLVQWQDLQALFPNSICCGVL
jgi:UDP-N-acetylglucosamine:LPS N-acetylglucosamine transferase